MLAALLLSVPWLKLARLRLCDSVLTAERGLYFGRGRGREGHYGFTWALADVAHLWAGDPRQTENPWAGNLRQTVHLWAVTPGGQNTRGQ